MKRKTNVRRMTQLALLMAIVLIMAFTPLGYLNTPWGVSITFIVIPVAVGSVVLGPGAGAFLGLVFGLTSLINAPRSAMGAAMLQISLFRTVLGCIFPRVLTGLIPGLLYRWVKRFRIGQAICCLLTPLLNTLLFMVTSWLIFSEYWLTASANLGYAGGAGLGLLGFMFASVAVNGIAEAICCLLLGTAVCRALRHAFPEE